MMKKSLLGLTKASLLATGAILAASGLSAVNAAMIQYDSSDDGNYGSDVFNLRVTLEDGIAVEDSDNTGVQFTLQIMDPPLADLRGFFFNTTVAGPLTITETTDFITQTCFDTNECGGGNNLNPPNNAEFDIGLELGVPGIGGGDDVRLVQFIVSQAGTDLTNAQFTTETTNIGAGNANNQFPAIFGARATSIGDDREGSGKLGITMDDVVPEDNIVPPPNPSETDIPEPSAVVGLMFLSGALAVSRRRS
ncbi:MAG: PEP-CTERM sorting domain-containing protein [Crocosphaera sp.]